MSDPVASVGHRPADVDLAVPPATAEQPPVGRRWIALVAFAIFGTYVAWITPMALSLAIRVEAIAPDGEQYLGVILGIGSLVALATGPLGGQLSDRTRTAIGRRRPWMIAGLATGVLGCAVMASAPSILLLGVGWVITQTGFFQVANNVTTLQADRLPEEQRGKVAGLTGFATMVAPVFGSMVGGVLAADPVLLFMVPAAFAVVAVTVFVVVEREADSRGLTFTDTLTVKGVLSKYVFDPRRYPDFGWNWIGRFLVFFGLTLNTTYTAYFYSARLDIPVDEIGGTVATVGAVGILGTIVGALGSGVVSDRLRRRKVFVIGSAFLFAAGSLVLMVAPGLAVLVLGAFMCNLAIGVFSAVDQALFLDILPEKGTDAGRFVNLINLANMTAQAVAPIVASALIVIGASGGSKNYPVVYVFAAVFAVVGAAMFSRIRGVR